jgi:uncharacterized membrane protein YhhN
MKKIILIIFYLASVGSLAAGLMELQLLNYIAKPLIMISLGAFYFVSTKEGRSGLVIGAILCSLAGDVFLLDGNYFIAGLISFLLGHVLYVFAYKQHRHEDFENALSGVHRVRLAFPIILAGSGLVIVLYPVLGDLKVPVVVYAAVLVTMVLTSLFRYGRTSPQSFWMVFVGAALFMISDSVLAINKFLQPVAMASFWIMLTYCVAQLLIVQGLLKHSQIK